uniref:acyltransferase n=1 Tax=Acetatifactor sp. TaxID=1872090 RepID=UPI0040575DC8
MDNLQDKQKNIKFKNAKTTRMANLELLRCIAMMMVVVLHYLGKSNLLGDMSAGSLTTTQIVAWVLEAFSIVAVNVYMLISGYFLSSTSFKLSRLIKLWLQVWFYSVGVGLLAAVTGILPAEECNTHYLLSLIFPVSMGHYWFMTAYIFLYLILPLIGMAVQKMSKGQMQMSLGGLLLVFCVLKSILPFRLEMDSKGYDCIWYLCVFLTAAYIRRFGLPLIQKKWKAVCLYGIASMAIFTETMCLHQVYLRTGSLGLIMKVALEYNHIFPFLAAVGLFVTFLMTDVSGVIAKLALRIAPYTLGVYLLHENMGVRYAWQEWLGANKVSSIPGLLFWVLAAVVIVFIVGVIADILRDLFMKGLHVLLMKLKPYRMLVDKVEAVDRMCKESHGNK